MAIVTARLRYLKEEVQVPGETMMALSVKDPEADRLARAVARLTGETLTQAVINSLRERLANTERRTGDVDSLVADGLAITRHCASLPVRDDRTANEILGYDERGLPR